MSSLFPRVFGVVWLSGLLAISALPAAAEVIPNDPYFPRQWHLRQIQAPKAWETSTGSPAIIVAIIDTGVDITHPDLKDNIWTNTGEIPSNNLDDDNNGYIDDVHGWNFITNTPNIAPTSNNSQSEEAWSHGTLVASLIGAKGNNGIGVTGVTWNVRLMPLTVLDADGFGSSNAVAKALDYATKNGARIVNMSLVGFDESENDAAALQRAASNNVLLIAATGNDTSNIAGTNLDLLAAFPVCEDSINNQVIGVSGTDPLDQHAPYANVGKTCTDISAPSVELLGARPSLPWTGDKNATTTLLYLQGVSGTSLATPQVSGVAALIASLRPTWTAEQIKQQLLKAVDSIEPNVTAGQKGVQGYGRLNAAKAVEGLNLPEQPVAIPVVPTSTTPVATSPKPARKVALKPSPALVETVQFSRLVWHLFR